MVKYADDSYLIIPASNTYSILTIYWRHARKHCLPCVRWTSEATRSANERSVQTIFRATVVAKLTYASPAWRGFASIADKDRLEAFLRRSYQVGFREQSVPTLVSIRDEPEKYHIQSLTSSVSSAASTERQSLQSKVTSNAEPTAASSFYSAEWQTLHHENAI